MGERCGQESPGLGDAREDEAGLGTVFCSKGNGDRPEDALGPGVMLTDHQTAGIHHTPTSCQALSPFTFRACGV